MAKRRFHVSGILELDPIFDPSDLPNLKIWLRADQGCRTPEDTPCSCENDSVNMWKDISGLDHAFISALPAFRPKWIPNAVNGCPAVKSDAKDDYMSLVSPFDMAVRHGPYTMLMIVKSGIAQICRSNMGQFVFWHQAGTADFAVWTDVMYDPLGPIDDKFHLIGLRRRDIGPDGADKVFDKTITKTSQGVDLIVPFFDLFHSPMGTGDAMIAEFLFYNEAVDLYDLFDYFSDRYGIF